MAILLKRLARGAAIGYPHTFGGQSHSNYRLPFGAIAAITGGISYLYYSDSPNLVFTPSFITFLFSHTPVIYILLIIWRMWFCFVISIKLIYVIVVYILCNTIDLCDASIACFQSKAAFVCFCNDRFILIKWAKKLVRKLVGFPSSLLGSWDCELCWIFCRLCLLLMLLKGRNWIFSHSLFKFHYFCFQILWLHLLIA